MLARAVQPGLLGYSAAISACENAAEWEIALELFVELTHAAGEAPDIVAYAACISALEKGHQWELMGLKSMSKMLAHQLVPELCLSVLDMLRMDGFQANEVTCTAALSACRWGS
eukprot:4571894-Amphidinium_carterae.2